MSARARGNPWLLMGVPAMALASVVVLFAVRPPASAGGTVIRAASLLGYQAVFLTIVSTAYMRRMLHWFGRPFLKVHHALAIAGLALVTLHPLAVVVDWGSARVLVPRFSSLMLFFRHGGAPALYLLLLAVIAAVYRRALGSRWQWVHMLTYVVFVLATVHGFLLGSDFTSPVVRIVASAMLAAVIYVGLRRNVKLVQRSGRRRG